MTDSTPSSSDHSVFISYARADNEQPNSETIGWVLFFWDQLRSEIKHPAASSEVLKALFSAADFQPAFAPRSEELNPKRD